MSVLSEVKTEKKVCDSIVTSDEYWPVEVHHIMMEARGS